MTACHTTRSRRIDSPCSAALLIASLFLLMVAYEAIAAPGAALVGENAPTLGTTAPAATSYQLGDSGVSEVSGAAVYEFPIAVPPGRRGMEPAIALTYSSRSPLRGGLAAGWRLDLPMIELDMSSGTLETPSFRVSLGGTVGRLVAVPDPPVYGGLPYRAEQDDEFTRFELGAAAVLGADEDDLEPWELDIAPVSGFDSSTPSWSSWLTDPFSGGFTQTTEEDTVSTHPWSLVASGLGSGTTYESEGAEQVGDLSPEEPAAWVAMTTDGVRHFFGTVPSATDQFSRWYLRRQVDHLGNGIVYHWNEVRECPDVGCRVIDHAISSIEYTLHGDSGFGEYTYPHARVSFHYASNLETCPGSEVPIGASFSHRMGRPYYSSARRLESVVTYVRDPGTVGWREVERTRLHYDEDALVCGGISAPLRFLTMIERSATSPEGEVAKLPPITFEYGSWDAAFSESVTVTVDEGPIPQGTKEGPEATLLDVNGDGIQDRARAAVATHGEGCELVWHRGLFGGGFDESEEERWPLPSLPWYDGTPNANEKCTLSGQTTGWVEPEVFQSNPLSCPGHIPYNTNRYRFADFDGDGRVDVATSLYHASGLTIDDEGRATLNQILKMGIYEEYVVSFPEIEDEALDKLWNETGPDGPLCMEGDIAAGITDFCSICSHAQLYEFYNEVDTDGDHQDDTCSSCNQFQIDLGYRDQNGFCMRDLGDSDGSGGSGSGTLPGDDKPSCESHLVPERLGDWYVWRVYFNSSDSSGFISNREGQQYPTLSPLPFAPDVRTTEPDPRRTAESQAMLDMDGDGILDLVATEHSDHVVDFAGAGSTPFNWSVWPGNGRGGFESGIEWELPHELGNEATPITFVRSELFPVVQADSTLAEVNGDGLPDLLVHADDSLSAYLSTGQGFAQTPRIVQTGLGIEAGGGDDETRFKLFYHVDVDGDGLRDHLDFSESPPQVALNVGDRYLKPESLFDPMWDRARQRLEVSTAAVSQETWSARTDFRDANGDGIPDLIEWDGNRLNIRHQRFDGAPPRLLRTVDNGRGLSTRFDYAPVTDPRVVDREHATHTQTLPHVLWVVDRISVEDTGSPDASEPSVTRYRYHDPRFDSQSGAVGEPQRFLGFSGVMKLLPGGGKSLSEFRFDLAGDRRGRPSREALFESANDLAPIRLREMSWASRRLFEGVAGGALPVFSHLDNEIIRSCGHASTPYQPYPLAIFDLDGGLDQRFVWEWSPDDCASDDSAAVRKAFGWKYLHDLVVPLYTQEGELFDNGRKDRRSQTRTEVVRPTSDSPYLVLAASIEESEVEPGDEEAASKETTGLTETVYDDRYLPSAVTVYSGPSAPSTTLFTYDTTGNVTSVTKPEQEQTDSKLSTLFSYDSQRLFVALTTDELGHKISSEYDTGTGALLSTKRPGTDEFEKWSIDGFGRPLTHAVNTPYGSGVEMLEYSSTFYDDLSQPVRVETSERVDLQGDTWRVTTRFHDGWGRMIEEVDGAGVSTYYTYDAVGNLDSVDAPDPSQRGAHVSYMYAYDGLGRVVCFTRPDGSGLTIGYDRLSKTVEEHGRSPDRSGCPNSPSGRITETRLDGFGRLESVQEIGTEPSPPTSYVWDSLDRLKLVRDSDGHETTLSHDWLGRRVGVARDGRDWTYRFDRNGNLVSETTPTGSTSFVYDELDRIVERIPGRFDPSLGMDLIRYEYHPVHGRLSAVRLPYMSSIEYKYDSRGLPVFEERRFSLWTTQHVTREFNALGDPTYIEYDDRSSWSIRYGERGLPSEVYANQDLVASFTRADSGEVTHRGTAFGQEHFRRYDSLGRPTTDLVRSQRDLRAAHHRYGYSPTGDLAVVVGRTSDISFMARYRYDGLHRLVEADGPMGYSGRFSYYPSGKIHTARVDWSGSPYARNVRYDYLGPDSQAVTALVDRATGLPWASFSYDASGNMETRQLNRGGAENEAWSFEWDGEDQLRVARNGDGDSEIYVYDHTGSRFMALSEEGTRLWFGASETHVNVDEGQTGRWIHVHAGGQTLARIESGGGIELQYSNPLQNLLIALDEDGSSLASFIYGPFGEILHSEGDSDHRRQFNGKENDASTGLRYYGFRYYDPIALRWISSDPLYEVQPELGLAEPQRLDRYAFSLNSPTSYLDPDGRSPLDYLKSAGRFVGSVAYESAMDFIGLGEAGEGAKDRLGYGEHALNIATGAAIGKAVGKVFGKIFRKLRGKPKAKSKSTVKAKPGAKMVVPGSASPHEALASTIVPRALKITGEGIDVGIDKWIPSDAAAREFVEVIFNKGRPLRIKKIQAGELFTEKWPGELEFSRFRIRPEVGRHGGVDWTDNADFWLLYVEPVFRRVSDGAEYIGAPSTINVWF